MGSRFYRKQVDGVSIGLEVLVINDKSSKITLWHGTQDTDARKGHWRRVADSHGQMRDKITRSFQAEIDRLGIGEVLK